MSILRGKDVGTWDESSFLHDERRVTAAHRAKQNRVVCFIGCVWLWVRYSDGSFSLSRQRYGYHVSCARVKEKCESFFNNSYQRFVQKESASWKEKWQKARKSGEKCKKMYKMLLTIK